MNAKAKMLEQLSIKLHKRAMELCHDATRLNGAGFMDHARDLRETAGYLDAIADRLEK